MYEILVRGKAAKQIQHLPPAYFRLLSQHIDDLAQNPRPIGAKKLKGGQGYRIRVGIYRILYKIDDKAQRVVIYRVKHRRDVYR